MKIRILDSKNNSFFLTVNPNITIEELKDKILEKVRHSNHEIGLSYDGNILNDDKKLSYYGVLEGHTLYYMLKHEGGGCIDNLKEESKSDIAKKIGFDMSLIKRDELNINLIHFDLHMTNGENYIYFNNFKGDVVGGFHATDDINIFKTLCQKISKKNIPFIVVSSGSSGKDVI